MGVDGVCAKAWSMDRCVRSSGSPPSGIHMAQQWRNGAHIWSGAILVWDEENEVHGRRDGVAEPGQWQVRVIVHEFPFDHIKKKNT